MNTLLSIILLIQYSICVQLYTYSTLVKHIKALYAVYLSLLKIKIFVYIIDKDVLFNKLQKRLKHLCITLNNNAPKFLISKSVHQPKI